MTEMERFNRIFFGAEYQRLLRKLCVMEKDRIFCRHTAEHFLDTARIMYIISLEEELNVPKDIIYAAALLHDIGRVMQYENGTPHDEASAELSAKLLPECGYDETETIQIKEAVLSHRSGDGETDSVLGKLLYRADKLSRLCFCCSAAEECYWDENRKNSKIIY